MSTPAAVWAVMNAEGLSWMLDAEEEAPAAGWLEKRLILVTWCKWLRCVHLLVVIRLTVYSQKGPRGLKCCVKFLLQWLRLQTIGWSSLLCRWRNIAVLMKSQVADHWQQSTRSVALWALVLVIPPGPVELVVWPGQLGKEASGCLEESRCITWQWLLWLLLVSLIHIGGSGTGAVFLPSFLLWIPGSYRRLLLKALSSFGQIDAWLASQLMAAGTLHSYRYCWKWVAGALCQSGCCSPYCLYKSISMNG